MALLLKQKQTKVQKKMGNKMLRFTTFIQEKIELPKAGNLGFKRKEMPQVEGKNISKFLEFLKSEGVKFKETAIDSKKLRPTQNQFNQDKIQSMIDSIDSKKQHPIMVSKDGYVIDGHHRWLAHYNLGRKMPVIEINLDIEDALDKMHDFPLSIKRGLSEETSDGHPFELFMEENQCAFITQKDMKELEKFADELLKVYGIDVEFTKHFGDRMSDERNVPCIKVSELKDFFRKVYANKGIKIKGNTGIEAVLNDIQKKLNMPVIIDKRRDGDVEVRFKTIMRKNDFKTPNRKITF
jgi:hypothetical protein